MNLCEFFILRKNFKSKKESNYVDSLVQSLDVRTY